MNHKKYPPWPYYAEDELSAVNKVLVSGKVNYWTGEECVLFEHEFAEYLGVKHAISLANGTAALELALYACGIGAGDEVIVTSRSFIASASSIVLSGATPVFVDVDENSQNIDPTLIESAITPKTKAIMAVHLAGWACEMDAILSIADRNSIVVIEDCAQAHGGEYKGKKLGSFGDVAAFSFCQDKIMSTGGEGGMLVTNNDGIWKNAWSYKDHGKSYEAANQKISGEGFRWVHDSFGTNWRLTEMQAAIGRRQLMKLEDWLNQRQKNADVLTSILGSLSVIRLPETPEYIRHANYKYYIFIRPEKLQNGWDRNLIITTLRGEGIPCFVGSSSEMYREKSFLKSNIGPAVPLKVAHELGENSIMFQVHPTLSETDMKHVAETIKAVLMKASK